MAERTSFSKSAAERIAKVVRIVEGGKRDTPGISQGVRLQPPAQASIIRFCSWTSTWHIDTTSVVTFMPNTAMTATATNIFLGVGPGEGWLAQKGTAGYQLIGAKLSLQPNYSSTEVQLFGHDSSAVAHWYSVTTCSTAAS